QEIINNNIIPKELIYSSEFYLPQLQNITPQGGVYIHVAGIDIVRDPNGNLLVLEDNLRIPSGVSYALTNRDVIQQLIPDLMSKISIRSIEEYPKKLSSLLWSLSDMGKDDVAVLLTPGPYNAAYYEHNHLARCMNWPLVQGNDLFVRGDHVYMKDNTGE